MPSDAVSGGSGGFGEESPCGEDVRRLTVLLASHDRLELLQESLASVLQQEPRGFQILVVDDGSGDETRAWLEAKAEEEESLKVIFTENQGVASARQRGLEEASTPWVCILDSDDLFLPGALARIAEAVVNAPETDLVYVDNRHLFPDGSWEDRPYPRYPDNRAMARAILLRPRIPFKHSGTVMKREVALELGGYDRNLSIKVDIDLFLRFLVRGKKVELISEPLVAFRMHRGSMSAHRFEGIRAWRRLMREYGPSNPVLRAGCLLWRSAVEFAKLLYLLVRIRPAN